MVSEAAKVRQALRLFENFSGHPAVVEGSMRLPDNEVLAVIGEVEAIAYTATRDGETASYQHEFRKSSRPVLAVSHDGLRLYLLAGAYKVTSHGIEDR